MENALRLVDFGLFSVQATIEPRVAITRRQQMMKTAARQTFVSPSCYQLVVIAVISVSACVRVNHPQSSDNGLPIGRICGHTYVCVKEPVR